MVVFVSFQTGIAFAWVYMSESVCLQRDEDDLGIRETAVNKRQNSQTLWSLHCITGSQ